MNKRDKKYFGTDGIRGRVGRFPITPDFVLKLGWAAGVAFRSNTEQVRVVIGKDTRISGYMFEAALEAGLASSGANVQFVGPMPTPAIAYLVRTLQADAGIVISASHNSHQDNGFKFFSSKGYKLADDMELMIEKLLDEPMVTVSSSKIGKAARVNDAAGRYIEFCKNSVPINTNFKDLKIVLDCAHGAAYKVAPAVFSELGAEIICIGVEPNGMNINVECGSTALETLQNKVLAEQANLGIAFDGDADRVLMVDHTGQIVDGDELLFIIAQYHHQQKTLKGGVVGTLMSNFALENALNKLNIPFARSDVGDRHVFSMLQANNWYLGGENSGHILHLGFATTGDAIIAALQVLVALQSFGVTLAEACQSLNKLPQVLVNVAYSSAKNPLEDKKVIALKRHIAEQLADTGRVLLRKSGTEDLIRVMVEAQNKALAHSYANELAELIKQIS